MNLDIIQNELVLSSIYKGCPKINKKLAGQIFFMHKKIKNIQRKNLKKN